jgi:hypothetical protein
MDIAMPRLLRVSMTALGWVAIAFALVQLVPYGRTHANPRTIAEPPWDSVRTRDLAVRACYDCHSNETRWPWYADLAPFSWVVERDVDAAREVINFSTWNRSGSYALAGYSGESVLTGNMPPVKYAMAHPEAALTRDEAVELARGLDATLKTPGRFH